MKAPTSWSYAPYRPANERSKNEVYISRVAPYENSVTIDWFCIDGKRPENYTVTFAERGGENAVTYTVPDETLTIENLETNAEYEFSVSSENGEKFSRKRLVRTGRVFGTVVNYLHPDDTYYSHSGQYLCSPCLLKLPDKTLLASMDVFEGGGTQNLTLIFKSTDGGKSWKYLSEVCPCFWGQLFLHDGDIYLLGCSTEYGDVLIGRSTDGGKTFGIPTVLGRGNLKAGGWHKAPCVVAEYGGRLYTAIEFGGWSASKFFSTCVFSAPVDSDLLSPKAWSITEPVRLEKNEKGENRGFIEGNVVELPDGSLVNILRSIKADEPQNALVYEIDTQDPEAPEVPCEKKINFPSHNSKFEIKREPESGVYYAIGTWNYTSPDVSDRRVLSLFRSVDGFSWEKAKDLLDIRSEQSDPLAEGFQYPSFEFDGENIIYLSRTALNKPHNFHDSNYTTFHIIENFRSL